MGCRMSLGRKAVVLGGSVAGLLNSGRRAIGELLPGFDARQDPPGTDWTPGVLDEPTEMADTR